MDKKHYMDTTKDRWSTMMLQDWSSWKTPLGPQILWWNGKFLLKQLTLKLSQALSKVHYIPLSIEGVPTFSMISCWVLRLCACCSANCSQVEYIRDQVVCQIVTQINQRSVFSNEFLTVLCCFVSCSQGIRIWITSLAVQGFYSPCASLLNSVWPPGPIQFCQLSVLDDVVLAPLIPPRWHWAVFLSLVQIGRTGGRWRRAAHRAGPPSCRKPASRHRSKHCGRRRRNPLLLQTNGLCKQCSHLYTPTL